MDNSSSQSQTPTTEGWFWQGLFPTIIDLLAILGIFFVAQIIGVIAANAMGYGYDNAELYSASEAVVSQAQRSVGSFSLVSYTITILLTIVATLVLRRLRGGRGRVVRFSWLGFNPSILLWGMLLLIVVSVIFEPLIAYLPTPPEVMGRGWAMILTVVVVAPLFEEFLCRGVILESVRAKSGVWRACIISSIFFGVLHLHPASVVNAIIVGLLLSYLCVRTNSIFAPIILHAFNNALAYMFLWLGVSDVTLRSLLSNDYLYWTVYGVALLLFIFSMYKVIRTLSALKKDENADVQEPAFVESDSDIFPQQEE
ncbi:MAG: CPBP family intramembrane glutamic endopeptidase [Rikenellaceae bacterium]